MSLMNSIPSSKSSSLPTGQKLSEHEKTQAKYGRIENIIDRLINCPCGCCKTNRGIESNVMSPRHIARMSGWPDTELDTMIISFCNENRGETYDNFVKKFKVFFIQAYYQVPVFQQDMCTIFLSKRIEGHARSHALAQ